MDVDGHSLGKGPIVSGIALAPGARWLQKSEKEVPFAGAIGLFYFAWYVVPLFTRDEYEVEFITSETLIMVSAGLILMGAWMVELIVCIERRFAAFF